MSWATVTPSLVTFGEPQPLSSTAFRPRGPSVLRTARDNFSTPAANGARASSSNNICFAATRYSSHQVCDRSFRQSLDTGRDSPRDWYALLIAGPPKMAAHREIPQYYATRVPRLGPEIANR